jgi:SpoVK/Ycf46/Vps4 family AAA+-type ATPase
MLNKKDQIHPNRANADAESIGERVARTTNNSFVRVKGFCKKSDKLARKKCKELQLENRKKAFGSEYMNLIELSAGPEHLNLCVQKATTDLNAIRREIAALHEKTERIDQKTKQKIILSKKDQTMTTPSVTVTATTTTEPEYGFTVVATPVHDVTSPRVMPTAPYAPTNPHL